MAAEARHQRVTSGAYSFAEGTWKELPTSPAMAPRFGHGAAVAGDAMYVYGGYVADDGSVTDEVWSFSLTSHSWTLVGPRADNFMEGMELSHVVDPEDAMMFPQMLPDARFSSVLLGRTTVDSFYIHWRRWRRNHDGQALRCGRFLYGDKTMGHAIQRERKQSCGALRCRWRSHR